jgi:hypothetical protein
MLTSCVCRSASRTSRTGIGTSAIAALAVPTGSDETFSSLPDPPAEGEQRMYSNNRSRSRVQIFRYSCCIRLG